MTPSSNCLNLIKKSEGCKLNAFLPTPNDVPTIGWGCTGPDIKLGMSWTQEQCDAALANRVRQFSGEVDRLLGNAATNQNQYDALVSFAYNEGAGRLGSSFILMYHRMGNYYAASRYFMHYTTQNHVVLNGLVARRQAEQALYLKPLSPSVPS